MKLTKTTPARVLAIVVATTIVGISLMVLLFLSSGNEKELLPPWQVFVAESVSVALLLALTHTTLDDRNVRSTYVSAFVIALVLTVLVMYFAGIGHTWSVLSVVGKVIATFLTLAYPILFSAVALVIMRRRSANPIIQWPVAIGVGVLFTIPMVLVGITLSCLVGDCL